MLRAVVLILALLASTPSYAEIKTVTIRGVMGVGSLDSGLGGLRPDCSFLTDSDIARKVFEACKFQDECEIVGTIDTQRYNLLLSLSSVRAIDTTKEPSVEIIKDVVYWAMSIQNEIHSHTICVRDPFISNFHNIEVDGEMFFEFNYYLAKFKCGGGEDQELGSGVVRVVKREGRWCYNK